MQRFDNPLRGPGNFWNEAQQRTRDACPVEGVHVHILEAAADQVAVAFGETGRDLRHPEAHEQQVDRHVLQHELDHRHKRIRDQLHVLHARVRAKEPAQPAVLDKVATLHKVGHSGSYVDVGAGREGGAGTARTSKSESVCVADGVMNVVLGGGLLVVVVLVVDL